MKCLLSQAGIDIDPVDEQLSTPLSVAATYDNHNSVKLLLKNGADVSRVDLQGHNVLHKAAREGNSKVVNIVIDHLKDDDEKLRSLMRQKDARGNTPFMLAVQVLILSYHCSLLCTHWLVRDIRKNTGDLHQEGALLPVHQQSQQEERVSDAQSLSVSCCAQHFQSCQQIFRSGDKKTAEILVKHGGNVNVLNNFNESPLYFAVDYSDNVELVQFLVEQ